MTLHYHGTPLTPRRCLETLKGRCFCVSYARPDDADWCFQHGQSVMWDNGAFTVWKRGGVLLPDDFARWVEPRLGPLHWAVVPDVIDGSEAQQRALLKRWPLPVEVSAPVWHMGLSLDWLLELADNWPRVCFGSSAAVAVVGSPAWQRRADEAFDALDKAGHVPRLWVHMLRGFKVIGKRWPFASADSTNIARNHARNRRRNGATAESMAARIDAVQCPTHWEKA